MTEPLTRTEECPTGRPEDLTLKRREYFRNYYNNKLQTNPDFYEKEKKRNAEYIRKRFHNDEDFKARCKEAQKKYRQRCKEALKAQKALGNDTNLSNIPNTSNSGIA